MPFDPMNLGGEDEADAMTPEALAGLLRKDVERQVRELNPTAGELAGEMVIGWGQLDGPGEKGRVPSQVA